MVDKFKFPNHFIFSLFNDDLITFLGFVEAPEMLLFRRKKLLLELFQCQFLYSVLPFYPTNCCIHARDKDFTFNLNISKNCLSHNKKIHKKFEKQ